LPPDRFEHDQPHQIVRDRQHLDFFADACHALGVQHVQPQGLLKVSQVRFDLSAISYNWASWAAGYVRLSGERS